jgi:class 3 adenylate cyclase
MSGVDDNGASFVHDFELFQLCVAAYGRDRTLAFARVIGAAVAALLEAGREMATAPFRGKQMTELELSEANEFAMAAWREIPRLVGNVMIERARRDIWFEQELLRGDVTMAVGFVDLVGSTEWTASLAPARHAGAIAGFEHTATTIATRHGCRVVKFIGDEAMIVGGDPAAVAEVAARLCAAVTLDTDLPAARGAVGSGLVTPRSGDYFGEIVIVVSRATKHAPAGGIVVTADVAACLDPAAWRIGVAHTVALRGIADDVRLVEAILA